MTLDHAGIAACIPHAGRMCLLDRLLDSSDDTIRCAASSHRDPLNPLRWGGRLPAPAAAEYASQAMALHAGLSAPPGSAPTPGFLAALRHLRLFVPRLDDVQTDLIVSARRLAGEHRQALYTFELHDDHGTLLADGRATVILEALS